MPITHSPENGTEVYSENRRRNRCRFLKSIFRSDPLGMQTGAENKHGRMQRKITNFPYNLQLLYQI